MNIQKTMDGQTIGRSATDILKIFFLGSALCFPARVSNYTMVQQEALKIHFSKNSPPLAIIEDEQNAIFTESVNQENLLAQESPKNELRAFSQKTIKVNTKKFLEIANEFKQQQKIMARTVEISPANAEVRDLGGITLDKNSVNIQLIKKEMGIFTPQSKVELAKTPRSIKAQDVEEAPSFDDDRVIAADGINPARTIAATSGEADSLSAEQVAANFANNALVQQKNYANPMAQSPSASSGGVVFHYVQRNPPRSNPSSEPITQQASTNPSLLTRPPTQALVGGTIEFADGLAYTGNQKVAIYKQEAGSKTADGRVMLNQGKFEIYVDNPSSGMIVADMYNNGQVVGHGEILLAEALKNATATGQLQSLQIVMRPTQGVVQSHAISAYAELEKSKDTQATTTINDVFTTKDQLLSSIILNQVSKPNFWGSLTLGTSTQVFKDILYPDKNIEALKEILGVTQSKKEMGIIRGVVKILGNPVAGAQVEFAPNLLQSNDIQKPIYFNSFIPDQSLSATTSNGEFAFLGVSDGVYVLRATYHGKVLSPQVVPVENGFVTQTNFNVGKPTMAETFVFDLQNSEMVSANVGFLGADHSSLVQGRKLLSFSGSNGVQFLEAQPTSDKYFTSRITVNKAEKEILIPMISQNWITMMIGSLKIDSSPDTAVIVGTAPEVPYQVELDPNAYNDSTKIIYYNRAGYPVLGATATPPGGGFVAFNVNAGMRSIFVNYQGQKAKKIVTMAADSTAINVFASKY